MGHVSTGETWPIGVFADPRAQTPSCIFKDLRRIWRRHVPCSLERPKEKREIMKKVLVIIASLTLVAAPALAQNANDLNPKAEHHETNPANGNNGNGGDNNGNDNPSNRATPGG